MGTFISIPASERRDYAYHRLDHFAARWRRTIEAEGPSVPFPAVSTSWHGGAAEAQCSGQEPGALFEAHHATRRFVESSRQ